MTRDCLRIVEHAVRLGLVKDVPPDTRIRRIHAGVVQRSSGAWSWFLHSDSDMSHKVLHIGSPWPASMIAGCHAPIDSESCGDWCLDPCDDCTIAAVRALEGDAR